MDPRFDDASILVALTRLLLCLSSPLCSKVQSSLLELRGTINRAEELLKSGAQSQEVEPVLSAARGDMSQIHIDVKDLSQTITIVEEVRGQDKHAARASVLLDLSVLRLTTVLCALVSRIALASPPSTIASWTVVAAS